MSDLPFEPIRVEPEPVSAPVEAWARALCKAAGDKPERIIGFPPAPAWRAYIHYAELAIKAQALMRAA